MNFDQFLMKPDAPDYYLDCVACDYCHDPENGSIIEDITDDNIYYYLTEIMRDEPSQFICDDCMKLVQKRVNEF